ncbi:ABC transporter substrate-binding protein [Oscillatoriales cyanobacterium LEGE 11467]|uniref:ABC transporter substrate-binding protein n=1 Tax=Zarconia navalis LEGE 11467 TaxID=1828826 RepID=A0A928VTX0_9CYAN|nr:ABC transporter substrate-binding protein [Zarconia navalis]MBE9040071.1 ABC transporter substrate-binding protein [Zarconia navalis LEGE 11467]
MSYSTPATCSGKIALNRTFNTRSLLSRFGFFTIGLLLVLLLNGCNTYFNREPQTLKVGMNRWPGFDVVLYAQEAGLFEKRGLNVELSVFENSQDATRAMIRGNLDAAFVPLWDVMQADPGNDRPAYVLVTNISAGADGIVAQPGIESVKDLRGKKVGAQLGTIDHLILLEALKLNQIDPGSVQIENLSNETTVQWMKEGRLDAAVVWEPLLSDTASAIGGNIIYTTEEVDSLVIDGLAVRSSFIEENRASLTQFILTWFDLMEAVETQPETVFASAAKQLGQNPEDFKSDYSGLKKGDIVMNRRMFESQGRLWKATQQIADWLREDTRHGRIIREDVEINAEPVTAAIDLWK